MRAKALMLAVISVSLLLVSASAFVLRRSSQLAQSSPTEGHTYLVSARDGKTLHALPHQGIVQSAAFSPDGELLVTASRDGLLTLWSVPQGKKVQSMQGPRANWGEISFSPAGNLIMYASGNGEVPTFDEVTFFRLPDGPEVESLARLVKSAASGYRGGRSPVHFSPDGELLAVECGNGEIRLVRIADASTVGVRGCTDWSCCSIEHLAFSSDSAVLAAMYCGKIVLWRVSNGDVLLALDRVSQQGQLLQFLPDGNTLVVSNTDGATEIWSVSDGRCLARLDSATITAVSPDGAMIAGYMHATSSSRFPINVWGLRDGVIVDAKGTAIPITEPGFPRVFLPQGLVLVESQGDLSRGSVGSIQIWRISDGHLMFSLSDRRFLDFSAGASVLAVSDQSLIW